MSCHENELKQLGELREDTKLHETITPPLQYLSVPNKQRTSSFVPKGMTLIWHLRWLFWPPQVKM